MQPIVLVGGLYNLALCVIWYSYVWVAWKDTQYNIQKWMFMFPLCKCLSLLQTSLDFWQCPWDSDSTAMYVSQIFEQIIAILIQILAITLINTLFYLMSHGWNITFFNIQRNMVTNVFMVGGSLYILMLAKQYTEDSGSSIQGFFTVIMIIVFASLLYTIVINLNRKIRDV